MIPVNVQETDDLQARAEALLRNVTRPVTIAWVAMRLGVTVRVADTLLWGLVGSMESRVRRTEDGRFTGRWGGLEVPESLRPERRSLKKSVSAAVDRMFEGQPAISPRVQFAPKRQSRTPTQDEVAEAVAKFQGAGGMIRQLPPAGDGNNGARRVFETAWDSTGHRRNA